MRDAMSGTSAAVYRKEQREKANALLEKAGYDTKSFRGEILGAEDLRIQLV